MEDSAPAQETPEVPYVLELNPALGRVVMEGDPVHESVLSSILEALTDNLRSLGILGHVALQIVPFRSPATRNDELARFSVHGHLCPYPDDVLAATYSYTTDQPRNVRIPGAAEILAQFQEIAGRSVEDLSRIFGNFFGFFCLEILLRKPSLLLDRAQVASYIQQLASVVDAVTVMPDAEWLLPILRAVLDCKIAIGDTKTVARVLSSRKNQPREVITEELIEALLEAPGAADIFIYLSREYLRQLTMPAGESDLNTFVEIRNNYWKITGITLPSFRLVADTRYPAPRFAFGINLLRTLPWIGMEKANDQTSEFAYFIECLKHTLWLNKHCFVRRQMVQQHLDSQKEAYPGLLKAITAKGITTEYITGVLRALVLEDRSIKDFRLILERILDYAYLSDDPAGNSALDLQFTSSGKIDSAWFRDPMHAVDYLRDALRSYAD